MTEPFIEDAADAELRKVYCERIYESKDWQKIEEGIAGVLDKVRIFSIDDDDDVLEIHIRRLIAGMLHREADELEGGEKYDVSTAVSDSGEHEQ